MNCVVGVEMERSEENLRRALGGFLPLCKIVKAFQGDSRPQGKADHPNTQHFLSSILIPEIAG